MYLYKPELKAQGQFPIIWTYRGKTKAVAAAQIPAKEDIEQQQQNSEEATPKNIGEMPTSQTLRGEGNLKSNTQNLIILDDGWVPLFRKIKDSQVWQSPKLLKVWLWCLLKASHKEQWVPVKTGKGVTEVHLLPGQFIFGRKSAAKELGMKRSTVYGLMGKLKNMQNLSTQSNTHYSVVTLTNWSLYRELMKKVAGKVTGNQQPNGTYK